MRRNALTLVVMVMVLFCRFVGDRQVEAVALGSISGTLSYSGSQTGTIYAAVFTTPLSCVGPNTGDPFSVVGMSSPGTYEILGLPDGTYYLASVMMTEGRDGDIKLTDPWGIYNGCAAIKSIIISGGTAVSAMNIALVDGTVTHPNPFYMEEKAYHISVSGNSNGTIDFVKTVNELWYSGFSVTGDGGGRDSGVEAILPFATHSPPLAYLPPTVGQSWTDTGDSNGYTVNSTATVKSVSQTITTPAGTFSNCAYVEENLSYPNGYTPGQPQPPVKYERWFCPGIGPVKVTITDSSPHTGELISYSNITSSSDYFPLGLNFGWTFRMNDGRRATWKVTSAPPVVKSMPWLMLLLGD
jgi:hypothetical protein